ncbi:MAG: acetylornithine deacetylase [Burkholderiaceae bacterium]
MTQSTQDILEQLIGFDTVSRHSNLALIDYVADYLDGHGVAVERVFSSDQTKANLLAVIGPPDQPGIVLSGHTDVVPVDGQNWSHDPFVLREADGRLYGRGTADMKGYIASVLSRVPEMKQARLSKPIILAFSYDEEIGCVGVRDMLKTMADWPVKPAGCIVGEPTSMSVVIGHKGKRSLRVTVKGTAAHSSLAPSAVNAVEYGARLTVYIQDVARKLIVNGQRDSLFDVPHTTAHVGVINGGTQLNIVPEQCVLDFEFRSLPEDDVDAMVESVKQFAALELEPQMQAVVAETGISFEAISGFPGLSTQPGHGFVGSVRKLANNAAIGKVAFGTEAGLFTERVGIPAVVCGPGSIVQAHRANEYIDLSQLQQCDDFISNVVISCTEGAPAG